MRIKSASTTSRSAMQSASLIGLLLWLPGCGGSDEPANMERFEALAREREPEVEAVTVQMADATIPNAGDTVAVESPPIAADAGQSLEVMGQLRVPPGTENPGVLTLKIVQKRPGRKDLIHNSANAKTSESADNVLTYSTSIKAPSYRGAYELRVSHGAGKVLTDARLDVR